MQALANPFRQRGAVALEFALIFVVFFAVFYGIVSYSLPLLLLQSFHSAAAEGARSALALERLPAASYAERVEQRARATARARLAWLPALADQRVEVRTELGSDNVLSVEVIYPEYRHHPLIPTLYLPAIGAVPRLPEDLRARAGIQL